MLTLRPYQTASIEALFAYWQADPAGSPLVVIPTGGGKSLIMARTKLDFLDVEPTTRMVCATHVKELIAQNYAELMGLSPWAPAGIFSASLGRRDAQSQILYVGIQTVWNKAERIGWVDVLFVDEAHLIPPDEAGMYGAFIAALRRINPAMLVVGFTATPYRTDSGSLVEAKDGETRLFDAIVFEISIRELIELGYLVPLISKATSTVLSTKGVARSGGDFSRAALQRAVDKHPITAAAVDEIIAYGTSAEDPRRSWLAFCAGVEHAHHVAEEIRCRGYAAEAVDGSMNKGERDRIIGAFRDGKLRALTNANVLTTGFNVPRVDLVAMLRPTLSTSLYVQMVGRGTRCIGPDIHASIDNGKANCLVLDFAGNVKKHGPVDAVRVRKPSEGNGEAPVKECPTCHSIILAAARVCPDCGHVFERNVDDKITASAGSAPILSKAAPTFVKVTKRSFFRHDKPGSPVSVRVQYLCGGSSHKEWICPEHKGFARKSFERFWKDHGGAEPSPANVDDTLSRVGAGELREVAEIRIRPSGAFWEICGRKFAPKALPWRQGAEQAEEGVRYWYHPESDSLFFTELGDPDPRNGSADSALVEEIDADRFAVLAAERRAATC